MKFTLSPIAAKVFGRSVQALAKVGEELVLSSTLNDGLILQSANTAKSAFGCVTFGNEFFQKRDAIYKFSANVNTKGGILMAFRFTANFERTLHWCELQFSSEALTIRLVSRADTVKVFHIRLIDGQNFVYNVDIQKYPNFIRGPARLFLDVVSQFHSKVAEVTLAVTSDKLTLRNFIDEAEGDAALVHSSITFERREFEAFDVANEAMDITFSLKTFKVILNYGELQNLDVNIHYDKPGAHVIVTLTSNEPRELNYVKITFVLATLDESTPDVVQEGRVTSQQYIRRKELSIRTHVTSTANTSRLQKITSKLEESAALNNIKGSRAKRAKPNGESDEEFANLLETDEDLHQITTQKKEQAVGWEQEKRRLTSQEFPILEANELDCSAYQPSSLVTSCEAGVQAHRGNVSTMAKILMQNQAKVRRGLLKVTEEEPEVLVPPSDDDEG